MLVVRSGALMAVLAILASQNSVRAQDADAKKISAVQTKCAEAKDTSPLRRLLVEKIEVKDKSLSISGVFLRGGLDKTVAEDVALNNELTPICEAVFEQKGLALKFDKLSYVSPKDLPHLDLQKLANAAGKDEILLDAIGFDKAGKAVLSARVGTKADKDWLEDAAKKLASASTKKIGNAWPPSISKIAIVEEWKLGKAPLQKKLAEEGGNLARIRIERVRYEWAVVPDNDGDLLTRRVAVSGLYLDSPLKKETFTALVEKMWPELPWDSVPKLSVDPSGAIGEGSEVPEGELVKALRTAIAEQPELDGVRIDPKMSFDAEGRLLLAGLIPIADAKFATSLATAVRKITQDAGKVPGREGGLTYSQTTAGGVSTGKMYLVPIALLLSEVRRWAADESDYDDVLLRRLYFDKGGNLTLKGKYAPSEAKVDVRAKVIEQFKTRVEAGTAFSGKGISFDEKPIEETFTPFAAGFTTFLRAMVEADQKKWAGVLLEHGYFTDRGTYGIRGLADRDDQPEYLAQVIKDESKNPRWEGYFDASPNQIDIKVMPLAPMLARLKRVAPGYEAFDHLEFTGVVQHTKDGLVFSADAFTNSGSDLAVRTADWLLKKHPDWKRRAKPGVKIKTTVQADTSDESRWLNPFYTAEALAKNKMPQAKLSLASTTRHFPSSSGTWYLSALYNSCLGDQELVRRDLYRVIQLEGQLLPSRNTYRNDSRTSRYDLAEKVHGPERSAVETMEPWLRREMRDGRPQIQLVPDPEVVLPK